MSKTDKTIMLEEITDMGKIAYESQLDRKRLLIESSNSLIIMLSLLLSFLGIMFPVILDNLSKYKELFVTIFILVVFILLSSLILTLIIQWRRKYKSFLSALDFYNKVVSEPNTYTNIDSFLEEKIINYNDTTKAINTNNNKRANLVITSHILIMIAVCIIFTSTLLLIGLEIFYT